MNTQLRNKHLRSLFVFGCVCSFVKICAYITYIKKEAMPLEIPSVSIKIENEEKNRGEEIGDNNIFFEK